MSGLQAVIARHRQLSFELAPDLLQQRAAALAFERGENEPVGGELEIAVGVDQIGNRFARRHRLAERQRQMNADRQRLRAHIVAHRLVQIRRRHQHRAGGQNAVAIGRQDSGIDARMNAEIVGVDDQSGR